LGPIERFPLPDWCNGEGHPAVQGFREVKQGAYMYLALDSSLLLPVAFTIVCLLHAKSTPSHSLFLTRSLLRACGLRNFTLTKAQHSLTHSLTHPLVITYWPFARSLAATFQHLRHLHYQHSLRDSTSTPDRARFFARPARLRLRKLTSLLLDSGTTSLQPGDDPTIERHRPPDPLFVTISKFLHT
jgi:hypothetical protein